MQDHTIFHHGNMLADRARLLAYRQAIAAIIEPNSKVVDIGAGTGILSAIASEYTNADIYSIEYFEQPLNFFKKILHSSQIENILPIQGSSFEIELKDQAPEVLVSETIGLIGPEENIVEIFYDFCRRHPSIKRCIPGKLRIFAQFIHSQSWEQKLQSLREQYLSASTIKFDYSAILSDLGHHLSHQITQLPLQNAKICSEPLLLTEYVLGESLSSEFNYCLDISHMRGIANAVHLYFEADLCNNILLTSHLNSDVHWGHNLVPFNPNQDRLELSYRPGSGVVTATWKE